MGEELHPSIAGVLRHFRYSHLPPALQNVSAPFKVMADAIAARTLSGADGPGSTVALWKLLEAKDAAVRAALPAEAK